MRNKENAFGYVLAVTSKTINECETYQIFSLKVTNHTL